MARPSSYTPAEDEIILATSSKPATVTNEMLRSAGYGPRTPDAIKRRRHYLKTTKPLEANSDPLLGLLAEKVRQEEQVAALEAALERAQAHLDEVRRRLVVELGEAQESLSEELASDSLNVE